MDEIGVGIVGAGFMGRAHSNAYCKVAKFFDLDAEVKMRCICGLPAEAAKAAAERWGWESHTTDWKGLVKRDDIQLVDVSAPSDLHRDVAVAAAENGKHLFCEKPLAFNLEQAVEMAKAAKKAGVKHFCGFSYRRAPALALAKQIVDEGRIGRIFHVRATYLQDWLVDPNSAMTWRMRKKQAGSGASGDLCAHIVDAARFLAGDVDEVVGMQETFIKERPAEGKSVGIASTAGEGTEKVDVDDTTVFLARMSNGALATFEGTRFAIGRKNYNRIEINGSKGSLAWNFERMNELEFFSNEEPLYMQGFKTILATEAVHPYVKPWWPPGHLLGYEHCFVHEVADLVNAITKDTAIEPDFVDGMKVQAVLEAVDQSIESRSWTKVKVPKV
jgi:predicted dehydrogenase